MCVFVCVCVCPFSICSGFFFNFSSPKRSGNFHYMSEVLDQIDLRVS